MWYYITALKYSRKSALLLDFSVLSLHWDGEDAAAPEAALLF
jgi:hypothetical protein